METQNFGFYSNFHGLKLLQKKKVGEKISRFCRTVLELSKQLLLPWQPVLGRLKFIYFHEIQR